MGNHSMTLLPPKPGTCQICAVDHDPIHPHNATSLYYQTKFIMENKREASWLDAMAHCTDEMKKFWIEELEKLGIDVKGGKIRPAQK